MTDEQTADVRILGELRTASGAGVAHIEDRFDTGVDDLWTALTDPARLARWLGEFDGELRPHGEFGARFFASGWEGTGRVEECDAPNHLLLSTVETPEPGEQAEPPHAIEAWLTPEGAATRLVVEERGMPVDQVAAYGAGVQIHVEDLASHLAGGGRCDSQARFAELFPAYRALQVSGREA